MNSSALRKRVVPLDTLDSSSSSSSSSALVNTLVRADVFPKVKRKHAENRVQTPSGAVISIVCYALIMILGINEIVRFITPKNAEYMVVDTSRPGPMQVQFDLTFPAIPCPEARVDVMDVAGDQQLSIISEIFKQRIDHEGNPLGKPYLDRPDLDEYRIIPGVGILRLKAEAGVKLKNEGCRVTGELTVNKVAGNFHIAIGKGIKYGNKHVHHFNVSEIAEFNSSHIINRLGFSFGKGTQAPNDPLAGSRKILPLEENRPYAGHFEYLLQIVPTTFVTRTGYEYYTAQYSSTVHYSKIDPENPKSMRLPGIFFVYKLSPFMVRIVDENPGFLRLLTSLFAIAGGVITISGIIDSIIFHLSQGTGILGAVKTRMLTPRSMGKHSKGLLD